MKWPEKLKEIPRVKMVMSPFPYSIEQHEPLAEARRMMTTYRIHHLPVICLLYTSDAADECWHV